MSSGGRGQWLVHVPTSEPYAQTSKHMAGVLGKSKVKVTFEGPKGKMSPRYLIPATE
jgi:hypothetical protein